GPQSSTTEPGSSSITTFARHVYQAGSRVGAARDGSATNRHPNTLSISKVAPARIHQDPRRATATGGRGPLVAEAGLTCWSVDVMGSPVGTGSTPAGGRPPTTAAGRGPPTAAAGGGPPNRGRVYSPFLATWVRSVLPGVDGAPGGPRRRRRRSPSEEPDRPEQRDRGEDGDDDRAAARGRRRRRRGRTDRRLPHREEAQAADRRVHGLLGDRVVARDRGPRSLVGRTEHRVLEPDPLEQQGVHEAELASRAQIDDGRSARLIRRRHLDDVAGDLYPRGNDRVGFRSERGHGELHLGVLPVGRDRALAQGEARLEVPGREHGRGGSL